MSKSIRKFTQLNLLVLTFNWTQYSIMEFVCDKNPLFFDGKITIFACKQLFDT